jgi:magnesium-protoporphyrin IX monomethyl ester (oxidative) cyclase
MTIETLSLTPRDTQKMAEETTMLSPRFYTTDFDALDNMDISSVRREWDELIAEMRSDPNKGHFKRNEDWNEIDFEGMPEELRKEFIDFLVLADGRIFRLRALQGNEEARQQQGHLRTVR